jgi:hypothetical protein
VGRVHPRVDGVGQRRGPAELGGRSAPGVITPVARVVEPAIAPAQQLVQVGAVEREGRQPDRDRRPGRQAGVQPVGDVTRLGLGGAGKQDGELVAAEPADGVQRAQQRAQRDRDPAQDLVAGGVALAVVDLLEAVEVEDQQRQRPAVAGGVRQLGLGALGEAAPVQRAGEPWNVASVT